MLIYAVKSLTAAATKVLEQTQQLYENGSQYLKQFTLK